MQAVFEKIIEKLEVAGKTELIVHGGRCNGKTLALGYEKGISEAIEIVKQEAEQYNNGWIPCSERLPNQDGEFTDVLITCESIADGVFVQSAEFYIAADGEPVFDALYHFERVLAWQQLPQPYQQKGEMDE